MLVLSRKLDEAVDAVMPDGRRVRVTIVRFEGTERVRLGFEAPEDVKIIRTELEGVDGSQPSE